nr:hypothetical protein Iba_chr09bCG9010 [Ipomoea batatas]
MAGEARSALGQDHLCPSFSATNKFGGATTPLSTGELTPSVQDGDLASVIWYSEFLGDKDSFPKVILSLNLDDPLSYPLSSSNEVAAPLLEDAVCEESTSLDIGLVERKSS